VNKVTGFILYQSICIVRISIPLKIYKVSALYADSNRKINKIQ